MALCFEVLGLMLEFDSDPSLASLGLLESNAVGVPRLDAVNSEAPPFGQMCKEEYYPEFISRSISEGGTVQYFCLQVPLFHY